MAQKKRKGGKKEKKVVHSGSAYIQATFNNTDRGAHGLAMANRKDTGTFDETSNKEKTLISGERSTNFTVILQGGQCCKKKNR